jgi:hypothetical protein
MYIRNVMLMVVVVVLVVGPISTVAMKAYCTLTPMEFRHSSPEALHTKRRERPLLAKDGTKAKEFSYQSAIHEITRFFYMPQSCGHGTRIFTSPPKEGILEDFYHTGKNPTASAGIEPANSGSRGQYAKH